MKEQVSRHYLDTIKRNFGDEALTPPHSKRSALVVGADRAGSIGEAVVKALAREMFANVYATNKESFNVLDPRGMHHWLFSHDLIDTLILCHGVTHLDWFENQLVDDIWQQVNINLTGTMYAIKAFIDRTLSHRHVRKHIVCVGSMAYNNVLNGSAPYCASKAGVAHLVRCLGWELTPKGYFIFGVHPSNVIGTPMAEDTIQGLMEYRNLDRQGAEAYWGALNLMPRWLNATDVAHTIVELVTGDHGWQTGTNIELTGGQR